MEAEVSWKGTPERVTVPYANP